VKAWKKFDWLGYDAVIGFYEHCNERSDSVRGKGFIHSFSDNLLLLLVSVSLSSHISTGKYMIITLATELINLVTNEYDAITYAQKTQRINWKKK
jgi:hypothetical protein